MRHMILLLLLALPLLALGQNPNPSAALDAFILEEMQEQNVPGMATVIVKGGEIIWRKGYGLADVAGNVPVSDNTIFSLASISKLFTGTALMQLAEDGQMDLDDPINTFMPFDVVNPSHPSTAITFRMLMTHTSSIQDNEPVMDTYYSQGDPTISLADLMERYFSPTGEDYDAENNFLTSEPGEAFEYSNIATALAGYLVERVAQMPFDTYCNQNIFDRICMNNSSWFLAGLDVSQIAKPHTFEDGDYTTLEHYGFADYPDGQLRSNVTDLAHFMIAFLQQGTFSGNQLLSSASVAEMLSAQDSDDGGVMGLNWYQEEIFLEDGGTVAMWGHNGGETGVSTDLYINPANGIGVAVLSNAEGDNLFVVDELYNYGLSIAATGVGNPPCQSTDVGEFVAGETFRLYPNPTNGPVFIDRASEVTSIQVFNMQGALLLEMQPNSSNVIDLSELPSGIYSLRLTGDNVAATGRVVLMD